MLFTVIMLIMILSLYFFMYLFSLATGSTFLVFTYIFPLLNLIILYHEPKLVAAIGFMSIGINIVNIVQRICSGEITLDNSKEAEIQMALIILCFGGCYVATRLYDSIEHKNIEYVSMLDDKNKQIQEMTLQTISTVANTIDAKDEYTKGHSQRVSVYSSVIAKEMGWSEEEVNKIRYIALLHDIGKIGIDEKILNKPGKLTKEEFEIMKQHTLIHCPVKRLSFFNIAVGGNDTNGIAGRLFLLIFLKLIAHFYRKFLYFFPQFFADAIFSRQCFGNGYSTDL